MKSVFKIAAVVSVASDPTGVCALRMEGSDEQSHLSELGKWLVNAGITYGMMPDTNLEQLVAVGWLNFNEGPQLPGGTAWQEWSELAISENESALAFEAAAQLSAKYLWTVETAVTVELFHKGMHRPIFRFQSAVPKPAYLNIELVNYLINKEDRGKIAGGLLKSSAPRRHRMEGSNARSIVRIPNLREWRFGF